jgi:hypothetical protein
MVAFQSPQNASKSQVPCIYIKVKDRFTEKCFAFTHLLLFGAYFDVGISTCSLKQQQAIKVGEMGKCKIANWAKVILYFRQC